MALPDESQELDQIWESLSEGVQVEIDQTQRELKEIGLMLEQSQVEVDKLAQKNATITMHLQQVQGQLETLPRSEIQNTYEAALDAQQRLVVMRSQLEKLQSEQNHLDRYLNMLRKVQNTMLSGADGGNGAEPSGKLATAEMMIQAQEAERQRLSRQIHDGPAQTLSNFILQTEIAMRLFDVDQEKAREELNSLKAGASTAFQQVRNFISDLRPMMLDDLGLVPTIKRYVESFREKTGLEVNVNVTGAERRFESYLEVMVFRAMQELLNNSATHSQASQIKVAVDLGIDSVKLVVEDNGRGFEPDAVKDAGLGMKLIGERADMLGGVFEIDSVVGEGARISLTLPMGDIPAEG